MSQDNQRLGVWHDMQSQHYFRENPADPDAPTLRDKFAMIALPEMIRSFAKHAGDGGLPIEEGLRIQRICAEDAYGWADAMLAARASKP